MKIKIVLSLSLLIFSFTLFLSAEESITITTYYPSPYGSYNELNANFFTYGAIDNPPNIHDACFVEGQTVYNKNYKKIYLCDGSNWKILGDISFNNLDCRIDFLDTGNQAGSLSCPAGYKLVTGGCDVYSSSVCAAAPPGDPCGYEDLLGSRPENNGWHCYSSHPDRHVKVHTYCCK